MYQFLLGFLGSACTSTLAIAVSTWRSGNGRRWLVRQLSALTGAGLERMYEQQRLASADLERDLEQARWVKVMTGRGNELTRDTFHPVWRDAGHRVESVQVLLPDPGPDASWLHHRAAEIGSHDAAYRPGLLHDQVLANIRYVSTLAARSPRIEVRLFDLPHTCRAVVTDRVAYLTLYSAHQHGRTAPCLVFSSRSPMYAHVLRLFTVAWDAPNGTALTDPRYQLRAA